MALARKKAATMFSIFSKSKASPRNGEANQFGRMDAFVVEHGPKSLLAYGLDWRALDGLGSLSTKAKKMARETAAKRFTVVRSKKAAIEPVIGLLLRNVKSGKGWIVEAAAACFAAAIAEQKEDRALYVGEGPVEGSYVLIGILHGIPSPEFDVVGDAETVLAAAENYRPYLAEGTSFYVHQNLLNIDTPPGFELLEFIHSHDSVVRRVTEMPYASVANSVMGGVMLAPDAGGPYVMAGGIFLGLAAVVGGYLYYQDWEANNNEKAKEIALKQAALVTYQTAVQAAFKSADTQLASPAANLIWEQVRAWRTKRAGWPISTVECAQGVCTLSYARSRGTTFRKFKESERPGESAEFDLSKLESASLKLPIQDWATVPVLDLASVVEPDVTIELGTQAQVMGLAGLTVVPKPSTPMADSAALALRKVEAPKYSSGTWDVAGSADMLTAAMARLPPSSTLSSVKFTIVDKAVLFTATGRYFTVRK